MVDHKSSEDIFDKEIQEVLMENTASSIYKYLRDMEDMGIYSKRWIWELIQNALDATNNGEKVEINVILEKSLLRFQHNGRPFKEKEIAHLICHGSTKGKSDIGQFGTGFLATHLLSKKVRVIARIGPQDETDFFINRDASTSEEMKSLMFEALDRYKKSCKPYDSKRELSTEYEYKLSEIAYDTAKSGIDDLILIAPYVLAFNPIIKAININLIEDTETIKFITTQDEKSGICNHRIIDQIFKIKPKVQHELWVLGNKDLQLEIAIKARQDKNNCIMEELSNVPKIFLALPLEDTQDLPFPVIINSKTFVPVEKRNGIVLSKSNTENVNHNKELIKQALSLFVKLLSSLQLDKWCDLHNLLVFSDLPKKEWLDEEWIKNVLNHLVKDLINVKLVKTSNGGYLSPLNSQIPCFDEKIDEQNIEKLWLLASEFSDIRDKLPDKFLLKDWARIIRGWGELSEDISNIKLPLDKLISRIVKCASISELEKNLQNSDIVHSFLNDLYKFIEELQRLDILDEKEIFPNQNNIFVAKSVLKKDPGIDNELKDISKMLNRDIRSELLHTEIIELLKLKLQKMTEEEIIPQLTSKIREKVLTCNEDYLKANIKLFRWLLTNGKVTEFNGYPVLTCEEHLFKNLSKETKLLPPVSVWNSIVRTYSDIFPQGCILSSQYDIKQEDSHELKTVIDAGYFYCSPIISINEIIKPDELQYYLFDSTGFSLDKSHELNTEVQLNDIAYFTLKDKGIVDTIRGSRQKAKKFLKFLFEYVAMEDKKWNTFIEAECSCGVKHKLRPCMWIHTLKKRKWIPKDMPLTPLNLAKLIEKDQEILELLEKDLPVNLLQILGVGAFEMKLNALTSDMDKRLEFDRSASSFLGAVKNPDNIKKIAQVMGTNPEVFIEEIEKTMQEKEKIKNNRETGALVEQLLKGLLEKEGFTVKRTGTGSDYLIEYDFIENESEVLLEVSKANKVIYYIEIKCTKQNFIKMSYEQGIEAINKKDKYILCVVQVDDDNIDEELVKNSVKFDKEISKRVESYVNIAKKHKVKEKVSAEVASIDQDVDIEITEGSVYFKIRESVWENGLDYTKFVEFVKANK